MDDDSVKIGAWPAKARARHRAGQLSEQHERLIAALYDSNWTTEDATPAALVQVLSVVRRSRAAPEVRGPNQREVRYSAT
ncbi:hypothetical protein GCM10010361_53140 [Streptomyces olivaceiscleroticus]|uniref:Transposase n=1 Tax=Streptomyces olivaceiscleroticus TaxID=68245 RepID=A0ABP3KKP5_9ACTN